MVNCCMPALPNLIVIGAAKSATTSLHFYLKHHPEIEMSRKKELEFFVEDKNWSKGVEWYRSHFTGDKPVRGESSPAYTFYPMFPDVPKRMHALIPDAKLIYLLRDPIERMISHYVHVLDKGYEKRPIEQVIFEEESEYYYGSKYFMQIERYLEYYPSDNILIITNEDLRDRRRETLRQVFEFVGVDPSFEAEEFQQLRHISLKKRKTYSIGPRLINLGSRLKKLLPLPLRVRRALRTTILRLSSREIGKPQLSAHDRARIAAFLAPDVARLRAYTGRSFDQWSV